MTDGEQAVYHARRAMTLARLGQALSLAALVTAIVAILID